MKVKIIKICLIIAVVFSVIATITALLSGMVKECIPGLLLSFCSCFLIWLIYNNMNRKGKAIKN